MCLSMRVRVCTRMMVTVFSVHVSEHVRVCTRMMVTVFSVHVSEHACTCVHAHDGNCVQCACVS